MSVTIEQDLKEWLEKIDRKLDSLQSDVTELKISVARQDGKIENLETRMEGRFNQLEEKLDGMSKRVDNQEFVNRGILIGLIVTILGGFAKLFGFVGNPQC